MFFAKVAVLQKQNRRFFFLPVDDVSLALFYASARPGNGFGVTMIGLSQIFISGMWFVIFCICAWRGSLGTYSFNIKFVPYSEKKDCNFNKTWNDVIHSISYTSARYF